MSATTFYNSTNLVGIGTLNAASVSTTLANVIQANIQSMNVSGDSNLSGNLITGNIIMSSNLSTNSGQGNVYISANLVVNGNIFSIGGSVSASNVTATGVQTITGLAGLTTLNATGNIYASNAVTTINVFTTNVTATGIQTIAGITGRTTLNVTGNIYASNAVTTTNIFSTNIYVTNNLFSSGYSTLGTLGTAMTNIITGSVGLSGITVAGSQTVISIGKTLAGTNYIVLHELDTGAAATFAVGVTGKSTTQFTINVAIVTGAGSTPTLKWVIIDLN